MRYMLLICSDGVPTAEKAAVMAAEVPGWIEQTTGDGTRLYGHALEPGQSARTVKVRDGQTLVSDGPFAESKEFLAGFDLIDAEDLDQAIAIAAAHPVAKFHCIEIRPFSDAPFSASADRDPPTDQQLPATELLDHVREGRERFLLLICVNGIPESDEVEEQIMRDVHAWADRLIAEDLQVFGHPLALPDVATTVRVRDGETVISDGPFVEAKEFIAGFTIVDCASEQDAIELAAANPVSAFHRLEVRRFAGDSRER